MIFKKKVYYLYYVNSFPNENQEYLVHQAGCKLLPNFLNRKFLDSFSSPKHAIINAKKTNAMSNGCKTCLPNFIPNKNMSKHSSKSAFFWIITIGYLIIGYIIYKLLE